MPTREVLIPEVFNRQPKPREEPRKVNLNQNTYNNNRTYQYNNYTQNNTQNIQQIKRGGLLQLILDIILLPFKIIIGIWMYFYKRYDLKHRWELESKQRKTAKRFRKLIKRHKSVYDLDEIY